MANKNVSSEEFASFFVLGDIVITAKAALLGVSILNEGAFFDEATRLSLLGLFWVFICRPAIVIFVLFAIYSICYFISGLLINKKRGDYIKMNLLLDKEEELSKQLSQIPRYQGGYAQEAYNQYFNNELNRAINLAEKLDMDDEDRQNVVAMLRNRNIVAGDNAGKYGYLKVIKTMFDECLRTRKGIWVDEISADNRRYPIDIKDGIIMSEGKYVTEKYFNFFNRVNNEINVPYQIFTSRCNSLGVSQNLKNLVGEYLKAKPGYIGEKRVAEELGRSIDNYLRLKGMVVIGNQNVTVTNNNPHNEVVRYDSIMQVILNGNIILKEMREIAEIIIKEAKEPIQYTFDYCDNYFNFYVQTKMLMEEYVAWRQANEELVEYANEYIDNILKTPKKAKKK